MRELRSRCSRTCSGGSRDASTKRWNWSRIRLASTPTTNCGSVHSRRLRLPWAWRPSRSGRSKLLPRMISRTCPSIRTRGRWACACSPKRPDRSVTRAGRRSSTSYCSHTPGASPSRIRSSARDPSHATWASSPRPLPGGPTPSGTSRLRWKRTSGSARDRGSRIRGRTTRGCSPRAETAVTERGAVSLPPVRSRATATWEWPASRPRSRRWSELSACPRRASGGRIRLPLGGANVYRPRAGWTSLSRIGRLRNKE